MLKAADVDQWFAATDWNSMLKAADVDQWFAAVKLDFDALVKTGCW
jgi:hypothetical protein